MDRSKLRVNGRRLRNTLEAMAKIGATPAGGVERLSLSDADRDARNLFLQWLQEIHVETTIDEIGNIFGRRPGKENRLSPVLAGSHIDSQPKGGRFDGILGVMGALEVFRTLEENGIVTRRPIVIVDWTNEEGSRFTPAMTGSGVWTGKLGLDWAYQRTDLHGKKLGDELARIGFKGKQAVRSFPVHAYFELHIEQGPILEREGKTIGVPKGIVCIHWYDVIVEGESNQTGPTPMENRHDALCTAAEMILKVNALPSRMGGNMVATVGEIHNEPNSRNIIPGKVRFTLDIRSWDDALVERAAKDLFQDFEQISQRRGCPFQVKEIWRIEHAAFDEKLTRRIWDIAGRLGYSRLSMVSGAGHDASYMNQIAPTAMIFVPSIGGRSHVEVENTRWEDCESGTNVLLHAILETADE